MSPTAVRVIRLALAIGIVLAIGAALALRVAIVVWLRGRFT